MKLINVSECPGLVFLPRVSMHRVSQLAGGALDMGLGTVAPSPDAAHEGHSVSCGGDRMLPALGTAPAHFPPRWFNCFSFLCVSPLL